MKPAEHFGATGGKINRRALLLAIFALLLFSPVYGPRLVALTLEFLSPGIGTFLANSDYVNYWHAGQLALRGETPLLYDPDAYSQLLKNRFGADYPPHYWSYPPHSVLIFLPLGLIGYKSGLVLFILSTFSFYIYAAWRFHRRFGEGADPLVYGAGLSGFVLVNLVLTQNGFLTGAAMLLFLAEYDRRPFLAASSLALLTIKPQLGLLIPIFLILAREWKVFAYASLVSLLFAALSVLAFGISPWLSFFTDTFAVQRKVIVLWTGSFLDFMPSAFASLRLMGLDGNSALQGQILFSICCLPLVLRVLLRSGDRFTSVAALLVGTFLVTPYSFNYDTGPLAALGASAIAARNREHILPATLAFTYAILPIGIFYAALANAPVSPLILLLGIIILGARKRSSRDPLDIAARHI